MQIKGIALRSTRAAVEREFGADGLARLSAALPDDLRLLLSGEVTGRSYPIAFQATLHDAIRDVLGHGDPSANRRIGANAGLHDFGGLYRVFILAASYETLLHASGRLFHQYNSQGRVEWEQISEGKASGRIVGVDGYNEAMWNAVAGRVEALLLVGGAKSVTVTITEWSPEHVAMTLSWTK